MSLSAFILFSLGIVVELALLWENGPSSLPGRARVQAALGMHAGGTAALYQPGLSAGTTLIAALGLGAAVLVGIFELAGIGGRLVYIDTPVVGAVMAVLLLGVVSAALFAGAFLPPVTEQSMVVIQGLVVAGALLGDQSLEWLPRWAVILLPAAVAVLLVAWRRAFSPAVKALLYLWYLVCLLAIPFQVGQVSVFAQPDLTLLEAFPTGMLLAFLALHGLFAVRFLIITLSMVRSRSRRLVASAMPHLFSDQQTTLARTGLVVVLVAVLLWANQAAGFLELQVALGLCAVLSVQLLSARAPFKDF